MSQASRSGYSLTVAGYGQGHSSLRASFHAIASCWFTVASAVQFSADSIVCTAANLPPRSTVALVYSTVFRYSGPLPLTYEIRTATCFIGACKRTNAVEGDIKPR